MTVQGRADQVVGNLGRDLLDHRSTGVAATVAGQMDHFGVPGVSIAVVDGGELAWTSGHGVTHAGGPAVTPRTIFQACSISKHVAAYGALRMVADGQLDLDEDVNAYLRSWRLPANSDWQPRVTLRQLLSHTAGLSYNWFPGYFPGTSLPTTPQTLAGAPPANTPPVRIVDLPGVRHLYSGANYAVVQQVMADVTATPFGELMRALVCEPLGMVDSSYDVAFPDSRPDGVARGHHIGGEPVDGGWRRMPESAGGGLWTTPADLARLVVEFQQPALLSSELVAEMLTPVAGSDYGLGVEVSGKGPGRRFGHSGSNVGYSCLSSACVEGGRGAVVMTSGDSGAPLVSSLFTAIEREYGWPSREPAPAAPAAGDCVGTYRLRPDFDITVRAGADGLELVVPGQPPAPLRLVGSSQGGAWRADAVDTELTFQTEDGAVTGLALTRGHELDRSGFNRPSASASRVPPPG